MTGICQATRRAWYACAMEMRVRVRTGGKKEEVRLLRDGRLGVSLREKTKGGAANARLLALVAKHFGVAAKAVRILRGHTTPSKTLLVVEK